MQKLILFIIIAIFSLVTLSFAEDIYESRLDKGLKNTEPYSYILIKKAKEDPSKAKSLLEEAIKYSPDLPAAYFELAKTSFSLSAEGLFESMEQTIEGFKAYKRNFWWLRSITGLVTLSLISSLIVALLTVVFIRFFTEASLLAHEITENGKKSIIVLFLIPLSFLGPLFFIAGALFLLGLYFRKIDKTIVYMSFIALALSPVFLKITNIFFSSASLELRAVIDVNESRDNKYAVAVLKGKNDFVSQFSYGLALKREGSYENALTIYNNLLSPSNPKVYINIGNCYFSMNDIERAKDFYKKSADIKPLFSAYYNLSQLSRETLDFAKGEEYFFEAMKLDRKTVSNFKSAGSRNPNQFVIDETLPMSVLWEHANKTEHETVITSMANPIIAVIIGTFLFLLFYIIDTRWKSRAYRCKRCGAILCRKCGKELFWGQMCAQCYKSLVKLDSLDPRERVARLLKVQEIYERKKNIARALSFLFPGVTHIYSGRILTGSFLLWMFLFLAGMMLFNRLLLSFIHPFSHGWITIPAVVLMVSLYVASNFAIRRRLSRGWH
ncbi:MAG: hypothetical protein HY755_02225 [Nitrospirae bacterium]|nr:hypothetical protein [Nitrospirota bacterium]